MRRIALLTTSLAMAIVLAGCSGAVKRLDNPPVAGAKSPAVDRNVKSFNLWLNDNAKKLAYDNLETFEQAKLEQVIQAELNKQNLVSAESKQVMDIELIDLNIKQNWSAMLFGPFAGSDRLSGIVTIKNANGDVLKKAQVETNYSFGGLGGGPASVRVAWLYEKFASLAAAELAGSTSK